MQPRSSPTASSPRTRRERGDPQSWRGSNPYRELSVAVLRPTTLDARLRGHDTLGVTQLFNPQTGRRSHCLWTPQAKFLKAEPNPDQAGPRKWVWIVLDSFVRFGAFQCVTGSPNQKCNSHVASAPGRQRASLRRHLRADATPKGELASTGRRAGASSQRKDIAVAWTIKSFPLVSRRLRRRVRQRRRRLLLR